MLVYGQREEGRALNNIEKLIGERIKRIKMPGYALESRETLLNTVKRSARPARTNKASETIAKVAPLKRVERKKIRPLIRVGLDYQYRTRPTSR